QQPGGFDAVTCMEMLEHVPDPAAILDACARALRPGGRLFVSTINRTPAAFALAIVGAEYVARLLPKGTHRYDSFIRPSELAAWLREAGLELEDVSGLRYEPWRNAARIVSLTDVNYLAGAVKPGARTADGRCVLPLPARGAVRSGRHPARQCPGHAGDGEPHARGARQAADGAG